jgi:hypothetical protein
MVAMAFEIKPIVMKFDEDDSIGPQKFIQNDSEEMAISWNFLRRL